MLLRVTEVRDQISDRRASRPGEALIVNVSAK